MNIAVLAGYTGINVNNMNDYKAFMNAWKGAKRRA